MVFLTHYLYMLYLFFFLFFFLHDAWPMQDSDPACLSLFFVFPLQVYPFNFFSCCHSLVVFIFVSRVFFFFSVCV